MNSCMENSKLDKTSVDGEFVHVVMFWLNESNDENIKARFESALQTMVNDSKYIKTAHIGTPANTPRGIVDNSYTYCYIAKFSSKEDQDKYQSEVAHDVFREAIDGLIDKIIIYDSLSL